MGVETIEEDLELVIHETCKRVRRRKNGPSADMLSGIAKMANALRQLIQARKGTRGSNDEDNKYLYGDPDYMEKMSAMTRHDPDDDPN